MRNSCTSGKGPSHFVVRQKFEIISLILTSVFVIALAGIITRLQALSPSGSPEIQFLVQTSKAKKSAFKLAIFALFKYKNDSTQQYFPQK